MELIDFEHDGITYTHTPDGRAICAECGAFSYDEHFQHCSHYKERMIKTSGFIKYVWRIGVGPRNMRAIGPCEDDTNWYRVILWFWWNK
jgi:hypothetical protein